MEIVLASSSPRRIDLLNSIDIKPDKIIAPELDERPLKGEKPEFYVKRIAKEKAIEITTPVNSINSTYYIQSSNTLSVFFSEDSI